MRTKKCFSWLKNIFWFSWSAISAKSVVVAVSKSGRGNGSEGLKMNAGSFFFNKSMRAMDSRRDFTSKRVFTGYFSELGEKARWEIPKSEAKTSDIDNLAFFRLLYLSAEPPERKPRAQLTEKAPNPPSFCRKKVPSFVLGRRWSPAPAGNFSPHAGAATHGNGRREGNGLLRFF